MPAPAQSPSVTALPLLGPGERVLRSLRQWLNDGRLPKGATLPSEEQLRATFGVSRTTIRKVLERLTAEGLIGFAGRRRVVLTVAPSKERLLASTVALLGAGEVQHFPQQQAPGWAHHLYTGVQDGLRTRGLHMLVLHGDPAHHDQVPQLIGEQPRGVVAFRSCLVTPARRAQLTALQQAHVPLVAEAYGSELPDCDTVIADHAAGAYALTRLLLARGCRRILRYWLADPRRPDYAAWLQQRDAGCERALKEARLAAMPCLQVPPVGVPGDDAEAFAIAARHAAGYLVEFVQGRRPIDAIMALSDADTFVLAAACQLLGKKPNADIHIVGFDHYWADLPTRHLIDFRPLATVDKGNFATGQALVALLAARCAGELPQAPQHRLLAPKLVTEL